MPHRLDSGVDGITALLAEHSAWASRGAGVEYVEHDVHLPGFTHITTVLRADPPPAAQDPAADSTGVQLATIHLTSMRDLGERPVPPEPMQQARAN